MIVRMLFIFSLLKAVVQQTFLFASIFSDQQRSPLRTKNLRAMQHAGAESTTGEIGQFEKLEGKFSTASVVPLPNKSRVHRNRAARPCKLSGGPSTPTARSRLLAEMNSAAFLIVIK